MLPSFCIVNIAIIVCGGTSLLLLSAWHLFFKLWEIFCYDSYKNFTYVSIFYEIYDYIRYSPSIICRFYSDMSVSPTGVFLLL